MSKSIAQFFPVYEDRTRRIQADIPASIASQADKIRIAKKLTWAEVMSGLLRKMVEDLGQRVEEKEPTPHAPRHFKLPEIEINTSPQTGPHQARFGSMP